MPFGLCSVPATFQRLVNSALSGLPNCNAYLDDLIVYSTAWEEHLYSLELFGGLAKVTQDGWLLTSNYLTRKSAELEWVVVRKAFGRLREDSVVYLREIM